MARAPRALLLWILTLIYTKADTGWYHLVPADRACMTVLRHGDAADLMCQHFDYSSNHEACTLSDMTWQRLVPGHAFNITKNTKYAMWQTVPGTGMSADEHVSVLRVRDVQPSDAGTYRCQVTCTDNRGRQRTIHHTLNLCVTQPNSNYAICGVPGEVHDCADYFMNGVCDLRCDSERHLYDGHDCIQKLDHCDERHEDVCRANYGNGVCDSRCENPACAWDGGDCIAAPLKYAEDTIVLYFDAWEPIMADSVEVKIIGRSVSRLLRTVVRVLTQDKSDEPAQQDYHNEKPIIAQLPSRTGKSLQKLYLHLDNTKCNKNCFKKAGKAAQFLALAFLKGWRIGIELEPRAVGVLSPVERQCKLVNNSMLQVDLSKLEQEQDEGSGGGAGGSLFGLETWVVVAVATAAVCLVVLVAAISLVVCRVRSTRRYKRDEQTYLDSTRVRLEKECPMGTDV